MSSVTLQLVIETLGWALVHFLWQGVVLGALFALARALTSQADPKVRYRLALGIFLMTALTPAATFIYLWPGAAPAAQSLGAMAVTAAGGGGASAPWWAMLEHSLRPYLPWLVAGWLAGVSLMSGRVCVDWWQVRQLTRRGVSPLPAAWVSRVADLVAAFGVSYPVRVLSSTVVRVPAVIGWLRPVILVPTAALTGLSPRQLELVIAHELSHIRRSDYLVNLLQVIVETLLFYHPVVSWMSNRLREEREHCCDDEVITTCGDTLTYAQALTELEAQRQESYQTALAASGGQLSQRIYRLLDHQAPRRGALLWSLSLVAGLAAASVAVATQLTMNGATPSVERPPVAASAPALATLAVPEPPPARQPGADPQPAESETRPAAGEPQPQQAPAPEMQATEAEPEPPARQSSGDATPAAPAQDGTGSPDRSTAAPATADVPEQETAPVREHDPRLADDAGGGQAQQQPETESPPLQLAMARRDESRSEPRPEPRVRGGGVLYTEAPRYPRRARVRGLQGTVMAEFTITTDGRVRDIRIVESTPTGVFDRAVQSALSEWRFEPLYQDGEALQRRVSKAFEFNLAGVREAPESADAATCDPLTGTRICRQWTAGSGEVQTSRPR